MIKTNLRLLPELYERIKALATKENRSVNGQMIDMLRAEAERREKANKKDEGRSV